jgi:hypothetical protein
MDVTQTLDERVYSAPKQAVLPETATLHSGLYCLMAICLVLAVQ